MFIVLLKLKNQDRVGQHLEAHKAWLQRGFEDGVFLLAGSLQPQPGGGILAHGVARAALEHRVGEDPFVVHEVARPEIFEITPSRMDERLRFLEG